MLQSDSLPFLAFWLSCAGIDVGDTPVTFCSTINKEKVFAGFD
jgi:hypothetical protein